MNLKKKNSVAASGNNGPRASVSFNSSSFSLNSGGPRASVSVFGGELNLGRRSLLRGSLSRGK